MDLISAKAAAAKESKVQKKPFYVIIDSEGEADLSSAPLKGVEYKFVNGAEDKNYNPKTKRLSEEIMEEAEKIETQNKTKTEKTMSTKKVSKPAKKVAAPKKVVVKKEVGEKKIPRGNNMFLTKAEWAKVDKLLEKEDKSFSAWSRELVQTKIK